MKKYLVLLLTFCLLFGACACSKDNETVSTLIPEEQHEVLQLPLVTADTVELYYSQTESGDSQISSICVGDGKTNKIEVDTSEFVDVSAIKERTLKINGKDILLSYQNTKKLTNDKEDIFNQNYDVYSTQKAQVQYYRSSGEIRNVLVTDTYPEESKFKEFSQDELEGFAKEIVSQYSPKEDLSKYTLEHAVYGDSVMKCWNVLYRRFVLGYPTDNYIWIWLEHDGALKGYTINDPDKYNHINENITKEHIDAAVVAAETKLNEMNFKDFKIRSKSLTTNSDGVLFVEIVFQCTVTDTNELKCIYAKVG